MIRGRRAVAWGLAGLLGALGACSSSSRSTPFLGSASTAAAVTTPPAVTPGTPGSTTAPTTSAAVSPVSASPPLAFGTRHCWPIVLVHGFPGWKSIAGVDYFYGVPAVLQQNGFEVFVTDQAAINTIEARAQQVHDEIVAQYPDPRVKFNLVGHSMGGLDIRYLISVLGFGDRVASATTISAPHHGTTAADVSFGLLPGSLLSASNVFFGLFGWDVDGGKEVTTTYVNGTFNAQCPDDPRVSYFSWAGHADPLGTQTGCTVDPALLPTWTIVDVAEGDNDGLISVSSARWGSFQGTVAADHFSEIGQPLGVTNGSFDWKHFYETWAEQLEARGFGP